MSVRDLAAVAHVSPNTVTRFEFDLTSNAATVADVHRALEAQGGPGIRLRKKPAGVAEISRQIEALDNTIADMDVKGSASLRTGMNRFRKALAQNERTKLTPDEDQSQGDEVSKGVEIRFDPLDDEHLRATVNWREQDTGGGTLTIQLTVRKEKGKPESNEKLEADAWGLAARLARAFAHTFEG